MLRTASLSHLTRLQRADLHHAIASAHEAVAESKRRVQKSSHGPVRVLCFPWVQNVVAVVGRVRDGFSSKPDVAASFLPTVAAVADHF